MTGYAIIDWAVGILASLGTLYGAYALGRKTLAEARATADPRTPYEALAARVTTLEKADQEKGRELSRLRRQVTRFADILTGEVRYIIQWIDDGAAPPPPTAQMDAARRTIEEIRRDNMRDDF